MIHRVIIQPRAQAEMEEAFQWIFERSEQRARRWFIGLQKAIDSLQTLPERCSLAPETEAFNVEIRQLFYGNRRGIYRILFTVQGDEVSVLSFRHGAQKLIEPE